MKKLLIVLSFILLVITGYSQATDVGELRIANATTPFGRNLPVGTKVYNIATSEYWVATAGVASTATLTTASASFTLLNKDSQNASEVDITDSGGFYNSTNIEGALQEVGDSVSSQRTDINQNASNISDVSDSINVHRTEINTINTKLDGIEAGAEVNYTMITEAFEEVSSTPTAHALSHSALTANGCRVSFNGVTLDPAHYTFTSSTITVDGPVYQYDKIVITYTY
jgi:hypothetical protein